MQKWLITLCLALALPQVAGAQAVWKCKTNGKTSFSHEPCPKNGTTLADEQLNANTIGAVRRTRSDDDYARRQTVETHMSQQAMQQGGPRSSCPSNLDIRNMETQASSNSLTREKKAFMQGEIRRARQCQSGQGHYTDRDWQDLKQARDDQSSLTGARAARARAEAIHSGADPIEADRIASERAEEERQRQLRARQVRTIGAGPIHCVNGKCTGPAGSFNRHGSSSNYTSPDGRFCRQVGNQMVCH